MAIFIDGKGTEWKFDLTFGMIEDIKEKIDLDLDMLINSPEEFGGILLKSPRKLVELFWCLCERQAMDIGMSPKDFGYLFDRGTLDKATNAFMEAVVNFYPRSSMGRSISKKLPQMIKEVDEKLEAETDKLLEEKLSEISSKKGIDSPVLSGLRTLAN